MTSIRFSLACLFCSAFAVALPAAASAKPDLKVTKLTSKSSVARGAPLSAKATVRASGKVAKPTTVGFLLSSNRTRGKGDTSLVGGEFVPALKSGKSSARPAVAFVPSSAKTGSYYLLACADARSEVKESSEKNNCVASKGKVKVVKPRAAAKLVPHLAEANAVSQLVTADAGGTLTATGPDGSAYKLEIPAGALTSDQTVKMTPVASIDGLPFAGAAAGVDLGPDGLVLVKSARLTITPAHVPPTGRQVTVGWRSGGQDLHLQPTSHEKGFVFAIDHFSGYEVVNGTPAQVAAQMQRPPISTSEQFQQAIYDVTKRAHDALEAGHDQESSKILSESLPPILLSYYDNTIKGLLEQAKSDDSVVALALTEALGWARRVELLGLGTDPALKARSDQVSSQLVVIVKNAAGRASDRCIAGDLGQIQRLIAIERFAQVLGFTTGDVFDKIGRCLHFELDYDASWKVTQPGANGPEDQKTDFTTKIAGLKLAARVDPSQAEPQVSQQLAYPTYTFTANNSCHADSLASSDEQRPFTVTSLDVSATLTTKVDAKGRSSFTTGPPEVTLKLDPGQRTENVNYACDTGGGSQHNHWFDNTFSLFHKNELALGVYTLTNWSPGTGGVAATKTYQSGPTTGVFHYSESSTFTLRHTPQK